MRNLTRGERFKGARLDYNQHGGQTMSAVENATGVSASLISDLENDEKDRRASYIDVATLARHYGVTTDWLCGLSEDHHPIPCASNELGVSENSIYFLKSLNDVRTTFDKMLYNAKHPQAGDNGQDAQAWNEAVSKVKCLSGLSDYQLRCYANLCANHGIALIDLLISAVEDNYRIVADFYDLREADPREWHTEERISFDDYVRFKAGEISKAIDRRLVSEFRNPDSVTLYYDRVTDEVNYQVRYDD